MYRVDQKVSSELKKKDMNNFPFTYVHGAKRCCWKMIEPLRVEL